MRPQSNTSWYDDEEFFTKSASQTEFDFTKSISRSELDLLKSFSRSDIDYTKLQMSQSAIPSTKTSHSDEISFLKDEIGDIEGGGFSSSPRSCDSMTSFSGSSRQHDFDEFWDA